MNSLLTLILDQNYNGFSSLINILFFLVIIGVYFIPLFFVVWDIHSRYKKHKFLRWVLTFMAILFLPFFVIMYFTHKNFGENSISQEREFELQLVTNHLVQCAECGVLSPKNANYCQSCGKRLYGYCRNCHQPYPLISKYCYECGFSLDLIKKETDKGHKFIKVIGYKIPSIFQDLNKQGK